MSAKKLYDRHEVLEAALKVFFTHGYEGTSIEMVIKAAGLNRKSLYAEFEDKEHLFHEVMKLYCGRMVDGVVAALEGPGEMWRLRTIMDRMLEQYPRGCLIALAIHERATIEDRTVRLVQRAMATIEEAFLRFMSDARARGELRPGLSPSDASRYFMTCVEGLKTVSKLEPRGSKRATVDLMVSAIENAGSRRRRVDATT